MVCVCVCDVIIRFCKNRERGPMRLMIQSVNGMVCVLPMYLVTLDWLSGCKVGQPLRGSSDN